MDHRLRGILYPREMLPPTSHHPGRENKIILGLEPRTGRQSQFLTDYRFLLLIGLCHHPCKADGGRASTKRYRDCVEILLCRVQAKVRRAAARPLASLWVHH